MSWIDILRMSGSNLKKRKLRTFLTVLGVIIGTTSIVVMISLGLGMQQAIYQEIEQSGGTSVWVFWYDTGESPVPWGIESDLAVAWTESDQPGALESLCRDWAGVQVYDAGEGPAIGG